MQSIAITKPSWFEPKFTLNGLIQIVALVIFLAVWYGHVNDRMQAQEDRDTKLEMLVEKQAEILQNGQLVQAQQAVLIQTLDRRLTIIEDLQGLTGRKR